MAKYYKLHILCSPKDQKSRVHKKSCVQKRLYIWISQTCPRVFHKIEVAGTENRGKLEKEKSNCSDTYNAALPNSFFIALQLYHACCHIQVARIFHCQSHVLVLSEQLKHEVISHVCYGLKCKITTILC